MSRKILYVGHGKTGTSTFGTACEILGYKLYENDLNLQKEVNKGNYDALLPITEKYDVFEDYPWPYVYKWFDETYPDTKFVFGIRPNEEEWLRSIIYQTLRGKSPSARMKVAETHYHEYQFGKYPVLYEKQYIEEYRRHNKEVLEYFKGRDDFLEISWWKGDGWEKLCNFLDKPIPDLPFPHRKNAWPYPNYERLRRLALRKPEEFYGW
jgi:hypothetical protein